MKPTQADLIEFAKLHAPEAIERMEQIKRLEVDLKAFLNARNWSLSEQNAKQAEISALRVQAKADAARLMQLWTATH